MVLRGMYCFLPGGWGRQDCFNTVHACTTNITISDLKQDIKILLKAKKNDINIKYLRLGKWNDLNIIGNTDSSYRNAVDSTKSAGGRMFLLTVKENVANLAGNPKQYRKSASQ